MRLAFLFASSLTLTLAIPALAMPHPHRGPTSPKLFKTRSAPKQAIKTPVAGIAPERATQIQTALIRSGYLTGEPSGQWDPATIAAVQRLQADNGWQTKLVPDSRAIIKLGLGPSAPTPSAGESETAEAATTSANETSNAAPANR